MHPRVGDRPRDFSETQESSPNRSIEESAFAAPGLLSMGLRRESPAARSGARQAPLALPRAERQNLSGERAALPRLNEARDRCMDLAHALRQLLPSRHPLDCKFEPSYPEADRNWSPCPQPSS